MRLFNKFIPRDETAGFLLSASLLSAAMRVGGVALGYLSHLVVSRTVGVHGYGIYLIALSWALVLALLARLGFDQAPIRYTTLYFESGEFGALRGFIRTALGTVALASVFVSGAFVLIGTAASTADMAVIIAAALVILPQAMLSVVAVIIRSSKRIFASQFYDQLLRPVLQIALLVALVLAGRHVGAADALAATAVASFAALGAAAFHFRRIFSHTRSAPADYSPVRSWFSLSVPLLLIAVSQELLNQLEIILLGLLGDAREAGLFGAAWRLASLVVFVLGTYGVVCGPVVASALHKRDFVELNRVVQFAARLTAASGAFAIVVLVLAGKFLLRIFGPEFDAAYPALVVLLAGGAVNAFTGVVAYLLTMTGHERTGVAIFGGALLVSFILNLVLIPLLGALGAAISSTVAMSTWNLAMAYWVRRELGIDATALGRPMRLAHVT